MSVDLKDLAHQLLAAAKKAGAEASDVLVAEDNGTSMEIRGGALEQAERAEGVDLGLRVLMGQRQACVAISDSRPAAIAEMAARAVAMAKEAPEDPDIGLATQDQLATGWDVAALDLEDTVAAPTPPDLEDLARRAEAAAMAKKGITQVSDAGASAGRTRIYLATSNGFEGGYARTSFGISCVAICGEGLAMERDYAYETRMHMADMPDAESIGALAAERALARAGSKRPKTGAYPVIFDERISSGLIGHLISAINGASIARGTSWLKDAMGEQVLPEGLSITKEPGRKRASGSRPFDAEGLPVTERALVEDGILKSWLLDLGTARKLGLTPSGDAVRGTNGPPMPGLGNLSLTQGSQSLEDLIREMGEGFLVTSLMGASINANTGDYSRGASGFWVRGGEIAEPVNEGTIAGNLRDMLKTITPANDARQHLSRRVPSLRVEGLTIAGN
ncbi:TldD/PmbA family protein [Algicella marina]|uniref:TldD/PmbA family protein n=1 Tax=Algicella marina TaxID=2683284 RepID=A0A6P1T4X9_9RHOB|nr:TldD/PmbA family protein [Algicella marina]QHQ36770.1 TldD/PmbA family protein [Algicella marina]